MFVLPQNTKDLFCGGRHRTIQNIMDICRYLWPTHHEKDNIRRCAAALLILVLLLYFPADVLLNWAALLLEADAADLFAALVLLQTVIVSIFCSFIWCPRQWTISPSYALTPSHAPLLFDCYMYTWTTILSWSLLDAPISFPPDHTIYSLSSWMHFHYHRVQFSVKSNFTLHYCSPQTPFPDVFTALYVTPLEFKSYALDFFQTSKVHKKVMDTFHYVTRIRGRGSYAESE